MRLVVIVIVIVGSHLTHLQTVAAFHAGRQWVGSWPSWGSPPIPIERTTVNRAHFAKGQVLFREGEPADGVFRLLRGCHSRRLRLLEHALGVDDQHVFAGAHRSDGRVCPAALWTSLRNGICDEVETPPVSPSGRREAADWAASSLEQLHLHRFQRARLSHNLSNFKFDAVAFQRLQIADDIVNVEKNFRVAGGKHTHCCEYRKATEAVEAPASLSMGQALVL